MIVIGALLGALYYATASHVRGDIISEAPTSAFTSASFGGDFRALLFPFLPAC